MIDLITASRILSQHNIQTYKIKVQCKHSKYELYWTIRTKLIRSVVAYMQVDQNMPIVQKWLF